MVISLIFSFLFSLSFPLSLALCSLHSRSRSLLSALFFLSIYPSIYLYFSLPSPSPLHRPAGVLQGGLHSRSGSDDKFAAAAAHSRSSSDELKRYAAAQHARSDSNELKFGVAAPTSLLGPSPPPPSSLPSSLGAHRSTPFDGGGGGGSGGVCFGLCLLCMGPGSDCSGDVGGGGGGGGMASPSHVNAASLLSSMTHTHAGAHAGNGSVGIGGGGSAVANMTHALLVAAAVKKKGDVQHDFDMHT
jgi:hypothetical protein